MVKNKEKEEYFVVKDFCSRPDDKYCAVGTKKDLAQHFANNIEDSFESHRIDKKPLHDEMYWVEFDKMNWAGCGGGSSKLFEKLSDVQKWIIEKIEEWKIDIGEVKFCIYPVYFVKRNKKR